MLPQSELHVQSWDDAFPTWLILLYQQNENVLLKSNVWLTK